MRPRIVFTAAAALMAAAGVMCLGPIASGQTMERARPTSSAEAAVARHGTIGDPQRGMTVSNALFVRMRGRSGAAALEQIAATAGLIPRSTSHLSFFDPGDPRRAMALLGLPSERRRIAFARTAELATVLELHFAADVSPAEAARRLMATGQVEYAEPIPLPTTLGVMSTPNDPRLDEQSHMRIIRAIDAWEVWQGDTATVVGIVDAGVDMFHEDLAPNISENPGETGVDGSGNDRRTNSVDDDGNGVIDDWRGANLNAPDDGSQYGNTKGNSHGTAVAGGAAPATDNGIGIAGPALRGRFFPVKTQPLGMNTLTRGYQGIEYCGKRGFKVVNCSWGGPIHSRTVASFIDYVIARYDIAIVAAAGNDLVYSPFYPAGYRGVLGVSATDTADVLRTTWGEHVDVAAPVGLVTTEDNGYHVAPVATSFSTPVAAGVVALARSRWPQLDAIQAIEHVRRTSDPFIDDPDKEKLGGYGRVNALRAVSVDPFLQPAVIVDTLWLTDPGGTPKHSFEAEERGRIVLRLRNVLGGAKNVRVRIVAYGPEGASVAIDTVQALIPNMPTGSPVTISDVFAFRMLFADSARIRLRVEITADGGYEDYRYENPFFHLDVPEFLLYFAPELVFSLSHRGNLGYADYPTNTFGAGVYYAEEQFLFEGGFMAAASASQLVSNVRGTDGDVQDRDFAILEPPGIGNDTSVVLSDAGAPEDRRIGLAIRIKGLVNMGVPNGFALRTTVRNTSAATIDSLRLAMFNDWDLAGNGDGQSIEHITTPGSVVPFHAIISGSGFAVASGVRGPADAPIFYAISNGAPPVNIYDGFHPIEKWLTLSSGVGSSSAGPADVSLVIGRTVAGLTPQQEDTVVFVFGIAGDSADATEAMRAIARGGISGGDEGTRGRGDEGGSALIFGAPRPNPAASSATIVVSARAGATLTLHDALGQRVADLSGELAPGDAATITIDTSILAAGAYYLRLRTGGSTITRELIVRP